MNRNRQTATTVGALFLISNVTFLLGAMAFVESTLGASDYLVLASTNRNQVILGALLEITNSVAYLGIAVLMYPILKQRFQSMALGYVGFRIIEFVAQILSSTSPLALVTLSEAFVRAGTPEASAYQSLGMLLVAERNWYFQMVGITFALGALLFYIMLYQTRLIPRFISVWGFVGAALVLGNTFLDMFGLPPGNLGILMLLNELFLGAWLIVRGFNPAAAVSEPARPGLVAP